MPVGCEAHPGRVVGDDQKHEALPTLWRRQQVWPALQDAGLSRGHESDALARFHTRFPFQYMEDFRAVTEVRTRLHAGRKPGFEQRDAALQGRANRTCGLPDRGAGNGDGHGIADDMQPSGAMRFNGHGLVDVRCSDARVNQRGKRIGAPAKLTIGCLHIAFCEQVAAGLSHVLAGRRSALTWDAAPPAWVARSAASSSDIGQSRGLFIS